MTCTRSRMYERACVNGCSREREREGGRKERERKRKREKGDKRIAAANNRKEDRRSRERMNIRLFILRSISCNLILSSPVERASFLQIRFLLFSRIAPGRIPNFSALFPDGISLYFHPHLVYLVLSLRWTVNFLETAGQRNAKQDLKSATDLPCSYVYDRRSLENCSKRQNLLR